MYIYIYINSSYSLSKEQRGTWVTTCTKASSSGQRLGSARLDVHPTSPKERNHHGFCVENGKIHGESWMILSIFGFKNRSSNK